MAKEELITKKKGHCAPALIYFGNKMEIYSIVDLQTAKNRD